MTREMQQFESKLAQLEQACSSGVALNDLLRMARETVSAISPVLEVRTAISESGGLIPLGCRLSSEEIRSMSAGANAAGSRPQSGQPSFRDGSVCFDRELSVDHRLIVQFVTEQNPGNSGLFFDAARLITDSIAVAAGRELASELSQRLKDREEAAPFLRAIASAGNFTDCAHTIVNDSSRLLGQARVTLLTGSSDQFRAVAVTGVRVIERDSDAVRRMERLAQRVVRAKWTGRWIETAGTDCEGEFRDDLAWFALNGVCSLRADQLFSDADQGGAGASVCVMMEIFEGQQCPSGRRVEFLMSQSALAIRDLSHGSSAGLRDLRAWSTRRLVLLASFVITCLLFLIPTDFEIEAVGQVFPVERIRIFAPDDGIVDALAVNADDVVIPGQLLLRLENPERMLERSRLLGEIDTTVSRLQAVRAARSSNPSGAGNPGQRPGDFSTEELQLEQKLSSLREEYRLVDEEIRSLSLHAPIAGVVYQRRLRERLESRPVQRGQQLMEIVNTAGAWQLELQIPEALTGYVRNSGSSNAGLVSENEAESDRKVPGVGQPVRFWLDAQRARSFESEIDTMELSVHIHDQRLTCLATAPCLDIPTENLRAGQAVTARIDCGRRSVGFVWFREVIEFFQKKKFAWF